MERVTVPWQSLNIQAAPENEVRKNCRLLYFKFQSSFSKKTGQNRQFFLFYEVFYRYFLKYLVHCTGHTFS